jgi:uncharacterized protein YndB with AHSA1/START domain
MRATWRQQIGSGYSHCLEVAKMKLQISVEIDRPIDRVFEYVSNPDKRTQWDSDLVETRRTSGGELGVGSTSEDVYEMNGRRMAFQTSITEWSPPSTLSWRGVADSVTAQGHWTFDETDAGTRVNLAMEMDTSNPIFKLMAPLMRGKMQQQMAETSQKMKLAAEAEISP